ncbi:hypothetical protein [Kribbella sindirgiensis]|uniref:Uncharacterized protein n=1 Tax=Kribbella sindirgiensis TaxID=1124744 RepID=A0A4R0JN61_9ACTN|nr:hypothetical protein [Kribbella sindirgiensis]TCC43375.1 hypothetical protein E0H50_02565 [Kribbella sindirgiensis]
MPDTDDDQSVELVPDQREQGDDDTEAASERRAAQARAEADKFPTHDLAEELAEREDAEDEQALLDEEAEARNDRLELAAKDEQVLDEVRDRKNLLDATAETTRAMQLAYADEQARDVHRQYAANDKQRGLADRAHGRHELDEAAAHPDEVGSAGLAAEGRRFQNLATTEERRSTGEYRIAEQYEASARDHREEAREAQPNPSEAVRKAPEETPEAQLPQARRHVRGPGKVRNNKGKVVKPNRASEPDLEL